MSPGSNGASQGADLTICKPTREVAGMARHRSDGLGTILNWPGMQKKRPRLAGGARGAEGLLWAGPCDGSARS
jgi:hypothetical protein